MRPLLGGVWGLSAPMCLQDPCNVVAIFSGSETHKLEEIFGGLPVWLAAENGVFVRPPPSHLPRKPGLPVSRSSACPLAETKPLQGSFNYYSCHPAWLRSCGTSSLTASTASGWSRCSSCLTTSASAHLGTPLLPLSLEPPLPATACLKHSACCSILVPRAAQPHAPFQWR